MRIFLAGLVLMLVGQIAHGQQTINAVMDDSVRVSTPAFRGSIQWQSSTNGIQWNAINQQTGSLLKYKVVSLPVYLRAAINEGTCQTFYSSFLLLTDATLSLATVITTAPTSITYSSAVSGGNISSDRGSAVTTRGIVFGTAANPTLSNTTINSGAGVGNFVSNMSNLQPATHYFVRSFATNAAGTAYGDQQEFTTSSNPLTTILMFVAHEDTYYSEYIVMRKALESSGYTVDLRSSANGQASIYMLPANTTINETAETLPGGTYAQFVSQFQNLIDNAWNASLNSYPAVVDVDGRIQDVPNMNGYTALVVVGGTGALAYQVDGTYASQGSGDRTVSAVDVQSAAEKLNQLALDALAAGKPVMAQCHGASLPAYWRIPNTSGPGAESLGFSLLKGQAVTGFPEPETEQSLTPLGISLRPNDRVTISSPHADFNDNSNGDFKIITTRDWYPQTVAHAAKTLLNVLRTRVLPAVTSGVMKVLILHGGAVDAGNCSPSNRANDVPCNFGGGVNLPADYTDIQNLLAADSPSDNFSFQVTSLNITGASLPFNNTNTSEILAYYNQFDVVLFFKHWSTGLTDAIQNALVSYADNGGGVLGLHHALYNDIDGTRTKNILVNQLFGAESSQNGWNSNLANYHLFATNYGHFISTNGISLSNASQAPATWSSNPLITAASPSYSFYHNLDMFDELYNNMTFVAGQTFGAGVNQITPIFSNDHTVAGQAHTSGFVKRINLNGDAQEGKVAYFIAGERKESININHRYGQIIRNALIWLAK
jgi:putative intracellular protease/amidase